MNKNREKLIETELKNATPMTVSLSFSGTIGDLPIRHTIEFEGMPSFHFRSNGTHVLKCLPLNQIGTGATLDEAMTSLKEDMAEILTEVINESGFSKSIFHLLQGKAATIYWDKHKQMSEELGTQAKSQSKPAMEVGIQTSISIDPVIAAESEKYGQLATSM